MPNRNPLASVLIFVSSPNDVQEERDIVDQVVDELNRHIAQAHGYSLRTLRWERDITPAGLPSPQAIDAQLPEYQVYVGIFWKRFGTPNPPVMSGTEAEFRDALASYLARGSPHILFYFCERPFYTTDQDVLTQFAKVVAFRAEVEPKVHTHRFTDEVQFERDFRSHLTRLILEQLPRPAVSAPRSAPASAPVPVWDTGALATAESSPLGRDDEIRQVVTMLRKRASFVIAGIGGIGKSTVLDAAIRGLSDPPFTHLAAHRITEEGSTDDRLRHLLSKLLVSFDIDAVSAGPQELFSQARGSLSGKRVLFAIDNADDVHSARVVRKVRDELPMLTLAVTSTQREWPGFAVIELGAMRPDPAAALYRHVRLADDDPGVVRRLCEVLDGHPMAIMQVAVEARERRLAAQVMLEQERRLGRDLTDRFEAASARLSDAGRAALAVIGQLAKVNVRLDLLKAVAGTGDADLRQLENQCLASVNRGSGELGVHRLVHEWCRARGGESPAGCRDGIARFYARFLADRRGLTPAALVEIDAEWENILWILDGAADIEALAELTDRTLDDHFDEPEGYVFRRYKTPFLLERSDRIEAFAAYAGGALAARLEKNLGHIFYLHGHMVKAQSLFVKAHERYRFAGDPIGVVATLWLQGYIADDENRYQDAERLYREGTDRARQTDGSNTDLLAIGHHLIGSTLYHKGDLAQAERHFRIAKEHLGPDSRPSVRSRVLRRLGSVLTLTRMYAEARACLASALRLAHAHAHNRDIARTTRQIGRWYLAVDDLPKAERALRWSRQRFERLVSRREAGGVSRDIAELKRRQGDLDEARSLALRSIEIAREFHSLFGEAAGIEMLAAIDRDDGKPADAIARTLHHAQNIFGIICHGRARHSDELPEPPLPHPVKAVMFELMDTLACIPADVYARRRRECAEALGVDAADLAHAIDGARALAASGALDDTQQWMRDIARRLGVPVTPAVVEQQAQLEEAMWRGSVELYPDAHRLLEAVAAKGWRVAIVTNGPAIVAPLVAQLDLRRYLTGDAFFLSSAFGQVMPDPGLYRRALAHLQVRPAECLFVGSGNDHVLDEGAMALGLQAVRVAHPTGAPYRDLKRSSRDWNYGVASLAQLVDLVARIGSDPGG